MKKQKTDELYVCRLYIFKDGRQIKPEDFDATRDLTEEQNAKIMAAFENVFVK